jgi:antitoxin component YwqK of YwqJK toxin-antitoxin module
MSKKLYFTAVLSLIFSAILFSQGRIKPLVKSSEVINEGIKLHDAEKYDDAIAKYKSINRNDSNYVYAMAELSYSYFSNKQHNAAVDLCKEMLKKAKTYRYMFYNSLGNSLDELNRTEEGIAAYKQGLAEFRHQYLLAFNLGVAYNKIENADSALHYLQKAVIINPYHASSHLLIGNIALKQGRVPHAFMAYSFFLTMEPESERAREIVLKMDKVASDDYEFDKTKLVDPSKFKNDNFDDIADLMKTKIALAKKYKSVSKLEFPITKQMQLMLEKLKYNENDKGFFMQFYVPYYTELWKKGQFKAYAYYQLASVGIEKVQDWLKGNKSKTGAFEKWAVDYIKKQQKQMPEVVNGKEQKLTRWYYQDHLLEALGDKTLDGKYKGDWVFFYYGGIKSAEGSFDAKGEKTGEWKWYYKDGTLQEKSIFVNGQRDGILELYHENGVIMRSTTFKNGKRNGSLKEYYSTGELKSEGNIVNEKTEGLVKYYFPNGKLRYEINYKADELDGSFVMYHNNGKIDTKANFVNGKKQGKAEYFFADGQLEQEGGFKDDKQFGDWKFYFDEGKLKRVSKFNEKGQYAGEYKEYYRNGKVKSEANYTSNGKPDGPYKEYMKDGTLWSELVYKGEQLQSYKYFDKAGTVISQGEKSGKKIKVLAKYQNGNNKAEGEYLGTEKDGEWKFYDVYGNLSSVENYKDGKLEGSVKNYFDNGNLRIEREYIDDTEDGYAKFYYRNGVLKSEGWYKGGTEQGEWTTYFLNGRVKERSYFESGEESGYQMFYTPQGFLKYEMLYKYGFLNSACYYDSTGKITDEIKLNNGDGDYIIHFPNGKEYAKINYKNGLAEGNSIFYTPSGKIIEEGNYTNDKRIGLWKGNYDNGNPEFEHNYFDGYLQGNAKWYHEDGNLSSESEYSAGDFHGPRKNYYSNKQLEKDANYEDDKAEGIFSYYSPDGALMNKRMFESDVMLWYTYLGKDGKQLASISMVNETGKMITYFQNGNKSQEQEYRKGYLVNNRVLYYSTGKIFKEEFYKDGYQEGITKEFYASGTLKKEENYFVDMLHGYSKQYHDNGKPSQNGEYVYGEKHGEWKIFDKTGKLILTKYYNNGVLYDEKNN